MTAEVEAYRPQVSIIVPVFNAKASLRRCVDSILGQEFQDFELILVDDGSSDGSGAICDAYRIQDRRVQTVHKENSGVSDARNLAIALARGEYLQFADSDDWITPDATRLMVRAAREYNCDLVITDFYRVVGGRVSHKGDIDTDGVMSRETFAEHMMENPADFYYGVLWNKLYRRSIIKDHGLQMDSRISWCEDFMFNLEYIRYAHVFYALRTPVYYYVRTKGSLVSQSMSLTRSVKTKRMVFDYYNSLYKHILDEETYEKNRLQVYRYLIDAARDGMVPPFLFPGSRKLGEERLTVCDQAIQADGLVMDIYRGRKLLEYDLRPVALKNDLSLTETWVLFVLSRKPICDTKKALADLAHVTPRMLSSALQKLSSRNLICIEEVRAPKKAAAGADGRSDGSGREMSPKKVLSVTIQPDCGEILKDFAQAEADCVQAMLDGFSEEEKAQLKQLKQKLRQNIQRIL